MDIKVLFKNPITMWLKYLYMKYRAKKNNKTLKIGYNSYLYNTETGKYTTIYDNVSINNCSIGDYTYISSDCNFANTKIGKYCSIGPGVRCGMGKHPSSKFVSTHPIFFSIRCQSQVTFSNNNYFEEISNIDIGNDVWIGANVVILDGIKIGDGSIIAAGAVVIKDVLPYQIVGGVPAKLIKYRFSTEERDLLISDKWWEKDINWLNNNFSIMHDIERYKIMIKE